MSVAILQWQFFSKFFSPVREFFFLYAAVISLTEEFLSALLLITFPTLLCFLYLLEV
jgi:hypothetical protein